LFDQGDLRVLVLHLIGEKPSHGYELIRAIEELTGGAYSPSPGVIYPTLTMLEELGHAQLVEEPGGRKLYSITDEGKTSLESSRAVLDSILSRMAQARPRAETNPGLQRAMENFRYALHLRLRGGSLDPAQIEALVGVLDETARTIEKI
jgi:DNA-binding PadR family transcriptional regulator